MPTVELADGPTLRYREWGRPDGAVLLMLHGTTSDSTTWAHVAPALGEHFRVIALDLRGRADSEWPDDYSLPLMADDVVKFMDALGILGAVLVGHSSGAVVAFLVASGHPERLRMLVLEELPPPDAAKPALELPLGPDPQGRYDWKAVIAIRRWLNAAHPDWWDLANRLSVRTLVVGATGGPFDQGRVRDLANAMPDARYVGLDLGHTPHTERPSAFLQVVLPFLAPLAK
jgi:pimeloyl-ACP methyl ester carboxylesterase